MFEGFTDHTFWFSLLKKKRFGPHVRLNLVEKKKNIPTQPSLVTFAKLTRILKKNIFSARALAGHT